MKEKVIHNKGIIILIASIVSAALLVPSFISFFGDEINDINVVRLVYYILLLLSGLFFVYYFIAKKEIDLKLLIAPVITFESAGILTNVFDIIKYNSWSAIYFAALYAATLVLFIIYLINKAKMIKIALYVLLLICLAFNLVNVFAGSTVELSRLIINLILIGSLYLIPEGGEQKWKRQQSHL